ncbi:MAG: winged helix-turn-helix domain-containing protein [Firmicutes bacterium]|nr:hypothetical protein [Alicyclobacillaceae bacterium]MCL6496046.1 winged helix-turn-helix domain-containing protein [Bacillota bacterium]
MEVTDLTAYLVLAYFAHTAANVTSELVPVKNPRDLRRIRDWLSSGFGVTLAAATGVDLLADLGISLIWPPAGILVTGILLGQGLKYGLRLLGQLPRIPGRADD